MPTKGLLVVLSLSKPIKDASRSNESHLCSLLDYLILQKIILGLQKVIESLNTGITQDSFSLDLHIATFCSELVDCVLIESKAIVRICYDTFVLICLDFRSLFDRELDPREIA